MKPGTFRLVGLGTQWALGLPGDKRNWQYAPENVVLVPPSNGRGLGNTFLSCPFVPSAAAQMIATAERTGTLATVTQLTGEFYEEEGETRLRDLATILEPLIIVVMGVVVAFVVVSVMLPVFDFAALAR